MNAGKRSGFIRITAIVLSILMLSSVIGLIIMTIAAGL